MKKTVYVYMCVFYGLFVPCRRGFPACYYIVVCIVFITMLVAKTT